MKKEYCDICGKELDDDIYSLKLYRWIFLEEMLKTKHICFSCYSKIKKYIKKISK